jgi:hypothetical protein
MTPTVSPIAAWVFAHGATAEEIVFRDVEADGELPGIIADERAAMDAVIAELRRTWLGVLKGARETVWTLSANSPCRAALRRSVNRDETIWSRRYVAMSPGPGLSAGVSLSAWGEDRYHLFVWLWVAPERQAEVEHALRDHQPTPWRNEHRSFLLTLDAPREGETWQAAGKRAGEALWGMVREVVSPQAA